MLDLLSRPSYIPGLREEIETVLAEDGEQLDADGHVYIPKMSFAKMKKLDSFIRESQRYNGLGFGTSPSYCMPIRGRLLHSAPQ